MLPAQSSRIQRELASLHCPASPAPDSPHAGKQDSGRSLATAPRSIDLAGAALGGWRPSFWKASEGSFGTHRLSVRGWRGWTQAGVVWRRPPGAVHGDSRPHAVESTPEPLPGALGALWQRRCPPASACSQPRPRLYARPPARPAVAHGHAGRSRSASGQACPSPAAPAPRATPPGPLRSAPLAVPISGRSLFSHLPVARPGRLIQCLVINLAFQNGQRAG